MPLPIPSGSNKQQSPKQQNTFPTSTGGGFDLDSILSQGAPQPSKSEVKSQQVTPEAPKQENVQAAPPTMNMSQFLNNPVETVGAPKVENPGSGAFEKPEVSEAPKAGVKSFSDPFQRCFGIDSEKKKELGSLDPFANSSTAPNFSQQVPQQPPAIPQQPPEVPQPGNSVITPPPAQGFSEADFGTTVPKFPINRYKASSGVVDRIAIITKKISIVRLHYDEDIGYFYCWGGVCCERCGMPNVRYVISIVKYDTDDRGTPVSLDFDVLYLQLGDEQYENLKVLDANVPIDTVDFLVTCADEKYQKNNYNNIGPALWKQDKSPILQPVLQRYESVKRYIPMVIARSIDEKYLLSRQSGGGLGISSDSAQAVPVTNLNQFLK